MKCVLSFQNRCNECYMETHGCSSNRARPTGPKGNVNLADHERPYPSICLVCLVVTILASNSRHGTHSYYCL